MSIGAELVVDARDGGVDVGRAGHVAGDRAARLPAASPPRSSEATLRALARAAARAVAAPMPLAASRDERDPAGESMIVGVLAQARLAYRSAPWSSTRPPTTRSARGDPISSGRRPGSPLDDVTLDAPRAGELVAPTTCAPRRRRSRCQAAGRARSRSRRSSPTTSSAPPSSPRVPDDELLEIYTALRPRPLDARPSSRRWAVRLDELGARRTAAFVREAAARLRRARARSPMADEPRSRRFVAREQTRRSGASC